MHRCIYKKKPPIKISQSLSGYVIKTKKPRAVYDVTKEEKLWPESEESKSIKVGFEVEQRGKEIAIKRLAAAVAHCAVRHFYDCPKNKFKIPEDRSRINWEN